MKSNTIYARYVKRIIDLITSLISIIILIPLFLIISFLIFVDSGKPMIYKQQRVGKNGKKFIIYKFRTMINGADKFGTSTKDGDSRVTKIGRLLRKTSLDELPQLFNVLKGDMSIIGFRPDVEREDDDYDEKKYLCRPGITGMAQVNGRSNITIDELHYWESYYSDNVSLLLDLKIFFKTFAVVLGSRGTN